MKKNRLMKVLAVISTAIMAVSAAGITAAADYTDTTEMFSSVEASSGATIIIEGSTAAPGQTVSVPVKLQSGNRCTSYDFSIEYDSSSLKQAALCTLLLTRKMITAMLL